MGFEKPALWRGILAVMGLGVCATVAYGGVVARIKPQSITTCVGRTVEWCCEAQADCGCRSRTDRENIIVRFPIPIGEIKELPGDGGGNTESPGDPPPDPGPNDPYPYPTNPPSPPPLLPTRRMPPGPPAIPPILNLVTHPIAMNPFLHPV